ncbi:MAG: prolyl aminopeptidase [Planctomycetota bacterium]
MLKHIARMSVWLVLSVGATSQAQTKPIEKAIEYYPEIEPFRTGFLKVSDTHEIYYELCGNPEGIPVMTLHGGPGGGSSPNLRRYHDPKKYLIVLHDQRGAGKSKPYAELRDNNTKALVEDIEKLRVDLKLGRVQLFGGSWGSTLALAYAERYPENVHSLVLRGIFTAMKDEIDHFYHGGTGVYFPEVYEKLKAIIPQPETKNYPKQLLDLIRGKDEAKGKEAARVWAAYETKCAGIGITDAEVENILKGWDPHSFSLIENYYMANNCFLDEGQLLRESGRLSGIPTAIVHGRYDVICPPSTAYRLHKALPQSRLIWVEAAGHSGGAPPVVSALIEGVKWVEPRIKKIKS